MKKIYFILFSLFLFYNSFSQKWSLYTDIGYGFNLSPESLNEGNAIMNEEGLIEKSVSFHSNGKGINPYLGLSYNISTNVDLSIGASYLYGFPSKVDVNLNNRNIETRIRGQMLRLIPSIKIKSPIKVGDLFLEFGGVLGFNGKVIVEKDSQIFNEEVTSYEEDIYIGNLSVGIMGGVFFQKKINNFFSIYLVFDRKATKQV